MKLICAIVKPFKVTELVDAFRNDVGFPGMTVLQGGGFGRARPHPHTPAEDLHDFTSHSVILVGVADSHAEAIMQRIVKIAHTGQPGDGKVFVVPLEAAIAITTGHHDDSALE
ncbi:MAG: P-II family nitrogen regulator [Gemmatimonadetes bacterium]|nr:P-II family nitrogen regulator [Gemmatimonadota bacterium]